MKELEEALIGNIELIHNILAKGDVTEPDKSYFEGKLSAYEWSLELLQLEEQS